MKIHLLVPSLELTVDYEMGGKILMLPAFGKGNCTFKFNKSHHELPHSDHVRCIKWAHDGVHCMSFVEGGEVLVQIRVPNPYMKMLDTFNLN
jgi:hypothetical protein